MDTQPVSTPGPRKPFWRRRWVIVTGAVLAVFMAAGAMSQDVDEESASAEPLEVSATTEAPQSTTTEAPVPTTTEAPAPTTTAAPAATTTAAPAATTTAAPAPTTTEAPAPPVNLELENAKAEARDYLDYSPFSRQGLIDQLSSEYGAGYPVDIATQAVDSLNEDWNAQAVKAAQDYLDYSPFSRQGLIDQLSSEYGGQFTIERATHGVNAVGLG